MKAISIREPFLALALVHGQKTIELRSWPTDYRGPLLICASALNKDDWFYIPETNSYQQLPAGCMIGIVNLIDCRPAKKNDDEKALSDVAPGSWSWVVEPVGEVEPLPVKGKLRFFDVPDELINILAPDDSISNYPVPQGPGKVTKKSHIIELDPIE